MGEVTALLAKYREGDAKALDALIPLVYEQLKKIARNQLRSQPAGHSFSPTGLVHEVFLKLKQAGEVAAQDRTHFFAIAAQSMRWLLADHARAKKSAKRGDGRVRVELSDALAAVSNDGEIDLAEVAEALDRLEKQDPRLARVVELRYLVGLTIEETAEILQISPMTVKRDWQMAKAWLARELDPARTTAK